MGHGGRHLVQGQFGGWHFLNIFASRSYGAPEAIVAMVARHGKRGLETDPGLLGYNSKPLWGASFGFQLSGR